MTRKIIAGALALAALSGSAVAQTYYTTQPSTTVVVPSAPAPLPPGVTSSSRTETTRDTMGREIQRSESMSNSASGATTSSTSTQIRNPDGSVSSQTTRREEHVIPPVVVPSETTRTTTITTVR